MIMCIMVQMAFLGVVTPVMHNWWDMKEGSEDQVRVLEKHCLAAAVALRPSEVSVALRLHAVWDMVQTA